MLTVDRYSNVQASELESARKGGGSGFAMAPSETPGFETNDGRFKELVFGTENGMVGQLLMNEHEMRRGWVIDPTLEGRRGKAGGVQCIAAHDITKDGVKDLLIGRDDGGIEVWSFDTGPQPKLVFEKALQESITSLECGLVTNVNFEEVRARPTAAATRGCCAWVRRVAAPSARRWHGQSLWRVPHHAARPTRRPAAARRSSAPLTRAR